MRDEVFLGGFSSFSKLALLMSCVASQCALGREEEDEHRRSLSAGGMRGQGAPGPQTVAEPRVPEQAQAELCRLG